MFRVIFYDSLFIKKEIKYIKVWEKLLRGKNEFSKFRRKMK